MSKLPSSQPGSAPETWFDDPQISNDDKLFRGLKTAAQIVKLDGGVFGISGQVWTSVAGGCSTELGSLIEAAGETPEARCTANGDFGIATISVRDVRSTLNRRDEVTDAEYQSLGVAYTPILKGQINGPNPFHCDIFPIMTPQTSGKIAKPGSRNLGGKHVVVYLDQARAAKAYAERHGTVTGGDQSA